MRSIAIVLAFGVSPALMAQDPLTARGLASEVISRSESPHVYDWRSADFELQLAYGYIDEANNFESEVYELGVGLPAGDGSLIRAGLRRAIVRGTPSSNEIGRTPFRQQALPTRYEVFSGFAYGLLEGRSMTRFSPRLPDFEHSMQLWGGGHYSHPNASWIPAKDDAPEALAGQKTVNSKIVLELGLRWQIYTPQSLGVSFEAIRCIPLGGSEGAHSWQYLSSGVLWSFGAR